MRVLGHRGARLPGPDNSLAAVRAALAAGAHGVEVDVRRDREGTLVCAHDPLPATGSESLTPVSEVIAVTRDAGARLVCEIKNIAGEPDFDAPDCATAAVLLALLGAGAGGAGDVVVSSFDWFSLEAVRAAAGPPTAFLTPPGVALRAGLSYAAEAGHAELHAHVQDVLTAGAQGVDRVHDAGLDLVAWPLVDVGTAMALRELGVDAVICDDPAAVLRAAAWES